MKLSKAQEKTRAALVAELAAAGKLVDVRFGAMLSVLKEESEEVNEAIRAYNLALLKAEAFATAIAEDFRGAFDDKSDGWKEGERGQEADSFISEWEGFEASALPEIGIIEPELEEKPCHAEALDSLPTESA